MNDPHQFQSHLEASSAAMRIFQAAFPKTAAISGSHENIHRAKQLRALLAFRAKRKPWKIIREKCESRREHAKKRQRDDNGCFAENAPPSSSSALVASESSDDSSSNGSPAN